MSKQLKAIIAGAVVILLLAGAIAALVLFPKSDDNGTSSTPSEAELITMIDEKSDSLQSLKVKNAVDEYTIELVGDKKWGIKALDGFAQLEDQYAGIASGFTTFYADTIIEESCTDFAKFGLDKPQLTATAKFANGKEYKITVGDTTPDTVSMYVMLNDVKTVYSVSSSKFTSLLSSKSAFLDVALVPALKQTEDGKAVTPTIERLEFSKPEFKKPIIMENVTETNVADNSVASIKMTLTSPVKCSINETNVPKLFFTVFGLTASSVETVNPTPEQLAKYGLDKPSSTYSLTYDTTSSFKLMTGKGLNADMEPVDENEDASFYYLMKDDIKVVYVVPAQSLTWIDAQPKDVISSIAILAPIVNLKGVDLTIGADTTKFLYTQTTDDKGTVVVDSGTVNGKTADIAELKRYLQLMYGTSIQDINTIVPNKKPDVTISYNYLDGKVDKVMVYVLEDNTTIISVNGNNAFKGRAGYVEKLKKELANLKAGKTVGTDW